MCGLVATISWGGMGVTGQEYKAFKELLQISAVRGEDSTGLVYVGENAHGIESSWVKSLGTASDLFLGKVFEKHAKVIQSSNVLLGHCRLATRGDISVDHAHPFEHKHITMIHNGTLKDIGCFPQFNKFPVDSQALCHALAEAPDPEEVLKSLDGAAAIMWWDDKAKTVNMWRNWDRPLHAIKMRGGATVFVASEERMLQWILERNNLGVFGNIFSMPTETLITWQWGESEPVVKEVRKVWNYGKKEEKKADNVVVLPSPKKEENEPVKMGSLVPVKNVFGLVVGDTILFEPTNVTYAMGDEKFASIEGQIASIEDKKNVNIGMLDNVMVKVFLRNKPKEEVETLFKAAYIKGKVANLIMNAKDISDVKCYVDHKSVEPFKDEAIAEALEKEFIDRHTNGLQ